MNTTVEDWKLQASIKVGPNNEHMLNVRAQDVDELFSLLDKLNGSSGFVLDTIHGITEGNEYKNPRDAAVSSIRAQFPETQQVSSYGNQPQTYGNKPQPPTCAHGAMKYYEGNNKNGAPFRAYFCPAPKGPGQCAAKFLD